MRRGRKSRLLKQVAGEIHNAVSMGSVSLVEQLLEAGVDVNVQDEEGNTPLHIACSRADWDMLVLLLMYRVNPLLENRDGVIPFRCLPVKHVDDFLMESSKQGNPRILVNLCDQVKAKSVMDFHERTMLFWAAANGHEKCVRVLLSMDADLRHRDGDGNNALLFACKRMNPFNPKIFKLLANAGCDVRQTDADGEATPLSIGLMHGDPEMLSCIVSKVLDMSGKTPTVKLNDCELKMLHPSVCPFFGPARVLDLRNNRLKSLPPDLVSNNFDRVLLEGNNLEMIPEPCRASWNKIRAYLSSIKQRALRWTQKKLLMVGEEGTGKTTLISTLKTRKGKVNCKKNMSTNGIEIHTNVTMSTEGSSISGGPERLDKGVSFNIWDLGGQECFYPTHRFFLTSDSVYVVVCNIAKVVQEFRERTSVHLQRIDYWLKQIRMLSNNSDKLAIFVVGTHADDPSLTEEDVQYGMRELRKKFPLYCFSGLRNFFAVSCRTGMGVSAVKDALCKAVLTQEESSMIVPCSWINLHDYVQLQSEDPAKDYISLDLLTEWATVSGVPREEMSNAMEFLSNVGVLMHFDDDGLSKFGEDGRVCDIVILHPQWLADVFACMVTFRHRWVKNGLLKVEDARMVFENYPPEIHNKLLSLLQAFNIVYLLPYNSPYGHSILVPSVLPDECDGEKMEKLWTNIGSEFREFGRVFAYPHVPSGFIARLIVRLLHLPDVIGESFWSHGLLLRFIEKRQAEEGEGAAPQGQTAPTEEHEQLALVWLDDESSKVFVRIRVAGAPRISSEGLLLRRLMNCIDTMNECYYNLGDAVEQTVPCTHCILTSAPTSLTSVAEVREPFYFTYAECVEAITSGKAVVYCNHIRTLTRAVPIRYLAPDVALTDLPIIPNKTLRTIKEVGRGGFGVVYKGTFNFKGKTVDVAIKELKADENNSGEDDDATAKFVEFQQEAYIMSCIQHRNLVRLYGVCLAPLRMVLEFVACGDLFHLLHPGGSSGSSRCRKQDFPWKLRLLVALDVALGMKHLASLTPPVIHRDLRSPNIFINSLSTDPMKVRAKVGDFGLSRMGAPDISGALGTWQWLAPEVISASADESYDAKSDVYSYAVCCYEIATRNYPFDELYNDERFSFPPADDRPGSLRRLNVIAIKEAIVNNNLRPRLDRAALQKEGCPKKFSDLITLCWNGKPSARPSFNAIARLLCLMLGISMKTMSTDVDEEGNPAHAIKFPKPVVEPLDIGLNEDWSRDVVTELQILSVSSPVTAMGIVPQNPSGQASPSPTAKKASMRNVPASLEADFKIWLGRADGMISVWRSDGTSEMEWLSHSGAAITSVSYVWCHPGALTSRKRKKDAESGHEVPTVWTSSEDGLVCVWDPISHDMLHEWQPYSKRPDRGIFSPIASLGAFVRKPGTAAVQGSGGLLASSEDESTALILMPVPSHNQVWCASKASEGIQVWSTETLRLVQMLSLPEGVHGVTAMCVVEGSPACAWVAVAEYLVIYELDSLMMTCAFSAHSSPVSAVAYIASVEESGTLPLVWSGSAVGQVRAWAYDAESGDVSVRVESGAHRAPIVGITGLGAYVFTVSANGTLLVWRGGHPIKEMVSGIAKGGANPLSLVLCHPQTGKLVTAASKTLSLWTSSEEFTKGLQVKPNAGRVKMRSRGNSIVGDEAPTRQDRSGSQAFFDALFQPKE